jgi:alpha-glucosidase (family GH31 glycosyl hydrolase)
MYNLGEQFTIDKKRAKANPKNVIQGKNYRFTILTERLIRLEYNDNGIFIDDPTERILYRDLPKTQFDIKEDINFLVISTKYFKLTYIKGKSFLGGKANPASNLKIELLNTDRFWYYGHPEVRNFGVPNPELSEGGVKGKGLFSADGIASIDDSNSLLFNEDGTTSQNNELRIDTYLFMYNKDFEAALKDYYKITGYPALIPRYALGNWWSSNNDYDDLKLKELVDNFDNKQIPLSILVLDKDWHNRIKIGDKTLRTGFTFNNKYFKNPKAMIDYIHSKRIRLGLSIDPTSGFYNIDKYYSEALKYIPEENGKIPFNVLNPKLIDVYFKLFIHPLDELGVDFYWLDFENRTDVQKETLLKHYQFSDMKKDFKRRPLILSGGSTIAPHRYPILYSGKTEVSWSTLRKIPLYNNNSFNNGAPFWAHDIGGYYKGTEDNELYLRSIQLGVFSPILKFGVDKGKYYKREPWRWDIKTYTIAKDYLQLRHNLIPYIYSEAYKYHKFGDQLIRPLYYSNPDLYDDVLYRNEYFFGQELFIAPIIAKQDYVMNRVVHNFYLPQGMWYDFVTGKKFPGDKSYINFFRDEDYPVFAKSGAIIPMAHNENINDTTPPVNMEINIFPGQSNSYTLFEDDGESDLYRKDYYLLTQIDYTYLPSNYSVVIRSVKGKSGIVPDKRNYKIVFRNTKRTPDVTAYMNRLSLSFKTYVDGPNFIVEIKDVPTVGQLSISCKGKDIEIDAVRLINEDIERIISDLEITTEMKEKIDAILFGTEPIKKKRIAIRKLGRIGLDNKFIKMFLKLLEYIDEI